MDRRSAHHADREVIDAGTRRGKGEIDARRCLRCGKGVDQSSVPDLSGKRVGYDPLGAKLFYQTLAYVEVNLTLLDSRRPKLDRQHGCGVGTFNTFVLDIDGSICGKALSFRKRSAAKEAGDIQHDDQGEEDP